MAALGREGGASQGHLGGGVAAGIVAAAVGYPLGLNSYPHGGCVAAASHLYDFALTASDQADRTDRAAINGGSCDNWGVRMVGSNERDWRPLLSNLDGLRVSQPGSV